MIEAWHKDDIGHAAAALSFYLLFSAAPLLVIVIFIVSFFWGEYFVQNEITMQVGNIFGEEIGEILRSIIESYQNLGNTLISAVVSVIALIYSSTRLFSDFKKVLNRIWNIEHEEQTQQDDNYVGRLINAVMGRLVAFIFILILAAFLAFSFSATTIISAFTEQSNTLGLDILNTLISFVVFTIFIALMYKYLPDEDIKWNHVWVGSSITSILFVLGQIVIQLIIDQHSITSAYGISGSLLAVLTWVYYSLYIVLIGAEITQIYSHELSSKSGIGQLS